MKNNIIVDRDWLVLAYQTRTTEDIAQELNVCRNTVRNMLIKFGIDRKNSGDYLRGKKKPPEQVRKMSDARKKYWQDHPDREDFKMSVSVAKRSTNMQSGYPTIYVPGRGFMHAHRYVMEQVIGRQLGPDEFVHHKNGDKTDNRIENLQLVTPSEHSKIHNAMRSKDDEGRYL